MTHAPLAVEFRLPDGVVIRGQRWPGSLPAVVLVHAPGGDRDLDDWRPLVPYLLGEGVEIVSIDLRGHGASDGTWAETTAVDDLAGVFGAVGQVADCVVVCAAGASCPATLAAMDRTRVAGLVLLSPELHGAPAPRGAGVPKLLVVGGRSTAARDEVDAVRGVSIGPALAVSLPVAEQGTDLLTSDGAAHLREHFINFLRERSTEANSPLGERRNVSDQFLERLGIRSKGVTE